MCNDLKIDSLNALGVFMGKKSQSKGRRGELELCEVLNGYGFHTQPGRPQNYGTEADLTGIPHLHIECKRQEHLDLLAAVNQSVRDAERFGEGLPVVMHRKNRSPWLVTLKLSDFITIYKGRKMNEE